MALRKAKIVYNFGLSECNRVNSEGYRVEIFRKFAVLFKLLILTEHLKGFSPVWNR